MLFALLAHTQIVIVVLNDETINNRYGDVSTFSDWENDFDYDLDSIVLSARFSKFGHCRYVKPEILQKL